MGSVTPAKDTLVHVGLSSAMNDPVQRRGRTFPPRIVSLLVKKYQAAAGMPLSEKPVDVIAENDVAAFVGLLRSSERVLPIACVALDQFTEEPRIEPDVLQRRLIGLAQVVVLHKRAGHRFTQVLREQLGTREAANKWSAYDGAVRVYWPGTDFAIPGANPFRHRLWFPGGAKHEREALENEIFDVLSWAAIHRDETDWIDLASIQRLRDRHAIEVERERATADASVYEGIYKNLEGDYAGLEARLKEAVERADEAEKNSHLFSTSTASLPSSSPSCTSGCPRMSTRTARPLRTGRWSAITGAVTATASTRRPLPRRSAPSFASASTGLRIQAAGPSQQGNSRTFVTVCTSTVST